MVASQTTAEKKSLRADPDMQADANFTGELNHLLLYGGFLSGADVAKIRAGPWKDRPTRMFTVLRHPVERAISCAMWWKKHSRGQIYTAEGVLPPTKKAAMEVPVGAYFDVASDSKRSWPRHPPGYRTKHQSFLHNGMTFQLGDYLDVRRRTPGLTDEEVLARAKAMLDRMDYVGFYEDLLHQYGGLWSSVFGPLLAESRGSQGQGTWRSMVTWVRDLLFLLGTFAGRQRMRVLKYSAMLPPEELAAVREANRLDIELWEYALELTGRRGWNKLVLYDSYAQWVAYELLPFSAAVVMAAAWLFRRGWCRCCWRCRRKPLEPQDAGGNGLRNDGLPNR